jgi:hypothetical protein
MAVKSMNEMQKGLRLFSCCGSTPKGSRTHSRFRAGEYREVGQRPANCRDPKCQLLRTAQPELAWRSVIERLNNTELKDCITFRVLGFYRRGWHNPEKLIEPRVDGPDALYKFRSSETILLKLLFFGDANRRGDPKSLKLEFDNKAFTSSSLSAIRVDGHYNEERILLPCARSTEPVITELALVQNEPKIGVWSPQPVFMVRVAPFWPYLLLVLTMVAVSFFLASLDKFSELWNEINWCSPASIGDHLAKVAGALLFFAAMWLFVGKFPLS